MAFQRGLVAACIACAVTTATAAVAGPSMSSAWLEITISQDDCVKQGSAAVRKTSFNTRFEVVANASVFGERGDYTALVRCAADKGIAYFVVAGPRSADASRYMN